MNTPQPEPRLFHLVRPPGAAPGAGSRASTGAAGLVTVAEGVEWSDGTVTLRWRGQWPATSAWEGGIDAVLAVHGRNGATKLRWLPAPPGTAAEPASTAGDPGAGKTAVKADRKAAGKAAGKAGGKAAGKAEPVGPWPDWQAASGLRLAAPGVDGRCVSCGLVWPCLSCGP